MLDGSFINVTCHVLRLRIRDTANILNKQSRTADRRVVLQLCCWASDEQLLATKSKRFTKCDKGPRSRMRVKRNAWRILVGKSRATRSRSRWADNDEGNNNNNNNNNNNGS
jgi:hypothetical protein